MNILDVNFAQTAKHDKVKKYFATLLLLMTFVIFTGILHAQSVKNDFNLGKWVYYYNHCWGIGPNTTYYGTKVVSDGFTGTFVCETANLGNTVPCYFTSPWIKMDGNDQITFDHEIPQFDGIRSLAVSLVSYPALSETLLWTYNYTDGDSHTATITHNAEGYYKVKWAWNGSGGNSRGQIDNVTMGGTLNATPDENCNPGK